MMRNIFGRLSGRIVTAALICSASFGVARADFGDPLPGLTAAEQAEFAEGRDAFAEEDTPATGLGPVFNDVSCAACHNAAGLGGGSDRLETRFGRTENGVFDPLTAEGGSLKQDHGIGVVGTCDFEPEMVPGDANVTAMRRTTPLFGLGFVDAVPDAELKALAALERFRRQATAGRPSMVTDVATGQPAIGRFGWKAQVPSLFVFSGDAYLNEVGITNPLFPTENCPQGNCALIAQCDPAPDPEDDGADLRKFTNFMTLLAAPPLGRFTPSAALGAWVFAQTGCADCHTPLLVTGASPVGALSHKVFRPFSDFLLHDMGTLGDGIAQANAGPTEMRTAPLWGLRAITTFLHDGRAHTVSDAILAHDGQGAAARERFRRLRDSEQRALLAFLGTL
jgi:CxxC motif-containing protein (DUF1111 family)